MSLAPSGIRLRFSAKSSLLRLDGRDVFRALQGAFGGLLGATRGAAASITQAAIVAGITVLWLLAGKNEGAGIKPGQHDIAWFCFINVAIGTFWFQLPDFRAALQP